MIYHVLPVNDLKEHQEDSTCQCEPQARILEETGDVLIIHNSFDGREYVEQANDIINHKNQN